MPGDPFVMMSRLQDEIADKLTAGVAGACGRAPATPGDTPLWKILESDAFFPGMAILGVLKPLHDLNDKTHGPW